MSFPQLTSLEVGEDIIRTADDIDMLFPAQRQLTALKRLGMHWHWLRDASSMVRVFEGCPNLEDVEVSCNSPTMENPDPVVAAADFEEGLAEFSRLQGLTQLTLDVQGVKPKRRVLKILPQLTGLQQLKLQNMSDMGVMGLVQLTSCRQLGHLECSIDPREAVAHDLIIDFTLLSQVSVLQLDWCL